MSGLKSASKQVIAVLIKKRFAFTGFKLSFKTEVNRSTELYPKSFYTRAHDKKAVSSREDKKKAKTNTIRWDVCSP